MENLLKANGIKIWFEEFGESSNETILLIMGANANCKQWPQEFIDELTAKNFRVVRFDNRDVGFSYKFADHKIENMGLIWRYSFSREKLSKNITKPKVPYSLKDMAKDCINILNEFYFKILYNMKKDTKKMKIPIINENSIN